MQRFPVDAVYSSPQLRARQTAEPVAKAHGLDIQVAPALCEVDFPRWVGMSWEELHADPMYEIYRKEPTRGEADGYEPIPKVLERTAAFLRELAQKNPDGRVALVSHADPLRTMLSFLLKLPIEEFRRFRISNASLTVVGGDVDRWILSLFNYRSDVEAIFQP
jgi:broad specificity phosphatase PhoE